MPNGDRSEHDDGAPEHQKEPIGTTRKLTAADRRQARAAAGLAQRVAEVEAKHEAERAAVRADDATFAAEVAAAREALEKMRRGCAA